MFVVTKLKCNPSVITVISMRFYLVISKGSATLWSKFILNHGHYFEKSLQHLNANRFPTRHQKKLRKWNIFHDLREFMSFWRETLTSFLGLHVENVSCFIMWHARFDRNLLSSVFVERVCLAFQDLLVLKGFWWFHDVKTTDAY